MIGQRLAERYEILSELGRGGMGMVYRARDPLLEREVAVKVISLARITAEAEERFRREALLVGQMDHPGIVPVYDLGAHQDFLFFVMPVVRGTTLQTLIRQRSLVLGDTLEIVAQVAEALDYSHARGVVHRDIKPENVMVTREDAGSATPESQGQIRSRVMDFGLALVGAASRLTRTGKLPGTLHYLSPEQILSAEIDGRSDLYSLGTILYECLAGAPPFSGSRYTLLYRIAHDPPPPLVGDGIDETLRGLVLACLAKQSADRPQRGNELADALRRYRAALNQEHRRRAVAERSRPVLGVSAATPLVGRRRECAELGRRLDEAGSEGCRFVAIGGEAGMGKTRLLRQVEETARIRGFLVLRGRFSSQDAFPYQGFGELIQDYFRARESAARTPVGRTPAGPDLRDLGADLATLFPVLQEIPAVRDAEEAAAEPALSVAAATADHTRIFELLARTLTRLAAGRTLVLLLEQIHVSEPSVAALQYLVRRLGPTPTLIVGTYRLSETRRRHPLLRLLRSFQDDPRCSSLVLEPLAEDEHRELLTTLLAGSRISDELVDKLYRASEGNPFFIQEWTRWLLETGDIWRDGGTWVLSSEAAVAHDALPETIQQAVESRLEQLPEERLQVLRTASILGRSFEFADLEALVGADVDQAVDELIREGLLEEEPRSREDRLTFGSRLVRETLYRSLPRRRRRRLHRRHAERLEARYAGRRHRVYARLVHHFAEGDVAEKTIRYALETAREALHGFGWEAAIRAARTALELVGDDAAGRSAEGELRRLLAAALRSEGQLEAALREAGRAVRAAQRAADTGAAAEAACLAAEIAWQGRKVHETRRWIAKGRELAREASRHECLRTLLNLAATLANLGGEYAEAQALRQEAEALAARRGAADEEPLPVGGTLVTTLPKALTSPEPGARPSAEETEVLANVYETLLASDADGNLIPTLCRDWQSTAGGRVFRFNLRPEVRFSDGTPVTAADVKSSFERAVRLGDEIMAPACRALAGIEAYRTGATADLAGVEVKGDHVLELRLRAPLPIFPALLTDPRTAVVRPAAGGLAHLGTGPFRWPPGALPPAADRVVLERNPHDWRGRPPPLEHLEFRVMPHASDVARALRAGEIDLARDLTPEDLEEILRDPRFRSGLAETTQKNVYFVLFNGAGPIARHVEVRRALAGVVRVRDVVWRTLGRLAHPATGLVPPGILGHDPGRRSPALASDDARALLAAGRQEALPEPLLLTGAVHPGAEERAGSLLRALIEEWSAVGVEVEPLTRVREPDLAQAADFDFCFMRWDLSYDDPDAVTYEMLHSHFGRLAAWLPTSAADPLLERARQEVRAVRRQRLYRKIEDLLAEQAAVLPLFHDVLYRVVSPRIRGLRLTGSPPFVNYSAIGKSAAAEERPRPARGFATSGTLHVPLPAAVASLEPDLAVVVEASEVVPNVFETLTHIEEGAHVVPFLAAEFRAEEGGRRYRFRLRHNVRFHDGRRLTVRDVRYSFERLLRTSQAGAATPLLPIRGARALAAGRATELAGFEVVSARELVLELEAPLSFFPALLACPTAAVVPEGAADFASNWRQGTAGTGPFRVVRLLAGERLELEANPHYWKSGAPRCDRLVFEFGLSAERILADFRAGKLAVASDLRPADLESLRRDPELAASYREAPGFSTYYLVPNSRRGPLATRERRQALAAALDVEGVVRETLGRVAVAARGLIPPGLLGQQPRARRGPAAADAAAAELLAGLRLRCAVHPAYRHTYPLFWQRLTEPLAAAGVELEVTAQDPGETLADAGVDLLATRWLADYPDSDAFVHLLHSTDGIDGPLAGHPEVDRLIARGRRVTNPGERHAIYHEIEQMLSREVLVVPLFHEAAYRFVRPEIAGLRLGMRAPVVAYDELGLAP